MAELSEVLLSPPNLPFEECANIHLVDDVTHRQMHEKEPHDGFGHAVLAQFTHKRMLPVIWAKHLHLECMKYTTDGSTCEYTYIAHTTPPHASLVL